MMIRCCAAAAVLMLAVAPSRAGFVSTEEMRDQIIKMVADGDWNAHTCRRVESLGKGTVSPTDCTLKAVDANTACTEIAKLKVPAVASEREAEFLVKVLMSRPVAKVLGIGYIVEGEKIYVQWDQIGR